MHSIAMFLSFMAVVWVINKSGGFSNSERDKNSEWYDRGEKVLALKLTLVALFVVMFIVSMALHRKDRLAEAYKEKADLLQELNGRLNQQLSDCTEIYSSIYIELKKKYIQQVEESKRLIYEYEKSEHKSQREDLRRRAAERARREKLDRLGL